MSDLSRNKVNSQFMKEAARKNKLKVLYRSIENLNTAGINVKRNMLN